MVVEFSVKNYRSIRDEARLSMEATHLVGMNAGVDDATTFIAPDGTRLLRSAVIYGANASGKSNVVRALRTFFAFARGSTAGDGATPIPVDPFRLDARTAVEPTEMEVTVLVGRTAYRYGFKATVDEVVEEWLFHRPGKRESRLFHRVGRGITMAMKFTEGERLESKTRKNALFLTVCAQFDGPVATAVLSGMSSPFEIMAERNGGAAGAAFTALVVNRPEVRGLLASADLGIQEFRPRSGSGAEPGSALSREMGEQWGREVARSGLIVDTVHRARGLDGEIKPVTFRLDREASDGTRRLFELAGALMVDLAEGNTCVIDELETRLHPALTRKVVELFHSAETNPKNAQLIFATHDTHLLDPALFRRDQVWFTEKGEDGATELYSLAEVKGVRENEAYERAYLSGRYGATPILTRFLDAARPHAVE